MGALRSRGYPTVDVPLGLLSSRVRYQVPALVLCDADAHEALARVLELSHAEETRGVRVMFLGGEHGALEGDPTFSQVSVATFVRPIDVERVCAKVEDVLGPASRGTSAPPSILPRRAPAIVPSARKPYRSDELPTSSRPIDVLAPLGAEFSRSPGEGLARPSLMPPSPAHGTGPLSELSSETRALLERAYLAASTAPSQAARPTRLSPDADVQMHLPEEVLAALDAPLDELGEPVGELDSHGGTAGGGGSAAPHRTEAPPPRADTGDTPRGPISEIPQPRPPSWPSEAAVTNPGGRAVGQSAPPTGTELPVPGSHPTASPTRLEASPPRSRLSAEKLSAEKTRADLFVEQRSVPAPVLPSVVPDFAQLDEAGSETDWPGRHPARHATPPLPPDLPAVLPSEGPPSGLSDAPSAALSIAPGPSLADITAEPERVGLGGAARALAAAIRERRSGALAAMQGDAGIRRVVLRDGDIVTVASGIEGESLVRFLETTGDMDGAVADQLARVLPPFGRHAGAALIANGHLQQDALWPVLRAHSEWLLASVVSMTEGYLSWEEEVPLRLCDEPAVFGGAAGSEVFVEAVRRSIEPARAYRLLGGGRRLLGLGAHRSLLGECALGASLENESLAAVGHPLPPLLETAPELLPILYALVELGVLSHGGTGRERDLERPADAADLDAATPPARGSRGQARDEESTEDPFDDQAFRARLLARRALVDEGDYFSILGVARTATSYEISRAYETLRRQLDPGRLTARTADLRDELGLVLAIVDEAHDILTDAVRRERYRRALDAPPLMAYERA